MRKQVFIDAALLPVACHEVLAEHAQIHQHRLKPRQAGQQRRIGRLLDRRQVQTNRAQNGGFHQRHRHRSGDIENVPFAGKVGLDIRIARLDAGLLFAAEHKHCGSSHDQRPERLQFLDLQRIEGVIGGNGREDVQRITLGMVQQRRAGHRQVSHSPGTEQIAEINQPLQVPRVPRLASPDCVVLGDVQMHCLYRQCGNQWQQTAMSLLTGFDQTGAGVGILDHRQQVLDQRVGVARVPLQDALQTGVVEIGQRNIHMGTQFAQLDHDVTPQVLDMPQRLPVDELKQTHMHRLPVDVDRQ